MNFREGSRDWEKSKVGGRGRGKMAGERDRGTGPSTWEQRHTLCPRARKSRSSHAEELQGSDKPATRRCYYFNGYRTGGALYFHQGFFTCIFFPLRNIQCSSDTPSPFIKEHCPHFQSHSHEGEGKHLWREEVCLWNEMGETITLMNNHPPTQHPFLYRLEIRKNGRGGVVWGLPDTLGEVEADLCKLASGLGFFFFFLVFSICWGPPFFLSSSCPPSSPHL